MTESLLRAPPIQTATEAPQAHCEITTRMIFGVPPDEAWSGLMFYEQIDQAPPLLLRVLLPVPIRTEGSKSKVGDEARCIYEGGHLIKRVTEIDRGRLYKFDVSEQWLEVGRSVKLMGGSYTLRELSGGRTEIALLTCYQSTRRPRWFWQPIETAVGHVFHRHILSAMRRSLRAPQPEHR